MNDHLSNTDVFAIASRGHWPLQYAKIHADLWTSTFKRMMSPFDDTICVRLSPYSFFGLFIIQKHSRFRF